MIITFNGYKYIFENTANYWKQAQNKIKLALATGAPLSSFPIPGLDEEGLWVDGHTE